MFVSKLINLFNFDNVKKNFKELLIVYTLAVIRPILNWLPSSYSKLIACLYYYMLWKFSLSEHLMLVVLIIVSM